MNLIQGQSLFNYLREKNAEKESNNDNNSLSKNSLKVLKVGKSSKAKNKNEDASSEDNNTDTNTGDTSENEESENDSEEEPFYTVFIDDNPVQDAFDSILLNTGIHTVSVISESYRTEVRTVRIEQAKKSDLSIQLKSIEPTLIITAPEGTKIQLDGEDFAETGKEIIISEGEHKVTFIIGDYEIIRSISAIKGKTYKANLAVDLQISEE